MDQKNWMWRKRSSEKRTITNDKADLSVKENGEENEKEKALEELVGSLNEKLASALSECNAKDELVTKFTRLAEEATAAQKNAEAEIMCLKEELEEATKQKEAANGRQTHLNNALKDCMQKLTFTREEMDQRVRDAVMRTSEELEKAHKMLEDKLTEANKKVTNLTIENSQLSKVLLVKGNIIENLTESNSHAEAEFNAMMSRLDSTEKENAFLRYDFQMLERELHSRNEEIVYIRRSADTSHKQQLENVKKIRRLEAECQRLRVLVRKRMPGQSQAILTNLKKEIEIEARNQTETRRNMNPTSGTAIVKGTYLGNNDPDILRKEVSFLVECLCKVEEENKNLKSVLARKGTEIPHTLIEFPLTVPKSNESVSSESWANALMSELEHFKNHKDQKMIGDSEMRLMDDFAEMEKLAIVAVDAPLSQSSPEVNLTLSDSFIRNGHENHMESTGKELVQVQQGDLEAILQLEGDNNEALASDLQQSQQRIASLQAEVEALKESNRMMEDVIENHKSINEELDTQFTVTRAKLNESLQKLSSLEVELEDRSHCCEDLEGTCLELQLQLQSINSQRIPEESMEKELQIQQTGWEITAASMKLAECQETILNLGKQLNALSLSEEGQLCPSASNNKTVKRHVTLLDQMLFDDETKKESPKSPTKKDSVNIPIVDSLSIGQTNGCNAICTFKGTPSGAYRGLNNGSRNAKAGALVILPGRKQGGGIRFLRKLLLRKKKGGDKRTSYSFAV